MLKSKNRKGSNKKKSAVRGANSSSKDEILKKKESEDVGAIAEKKISKISKISKIRVINAKIFRISALFFLLILSVIVVAMEGMSRGVGMGDVTHYVYISTLMASLLFPLVGFIAVKRD